MEIKTVIKMLTVNSTATVYDIGRGKTIQDWIRESKRQRKLLTMTLALEFTSFFLNLPVCLIYFSKNYTRSILAKFVDTRIFLATFLSGLFMSINLLILLCCFWQTNLSEEDRSYFCQNACYELNMLFSLSLSLSIDQWNSPSKQINSMTVLIIILISLYCNL